MTPPTVRAATIDDVDAVLRFWLLAGENGDRPADHPGAVASLIRRDPGALLLALDDDQLVGTVIAGWDGWRAHLYRLAVHPDRRRRGTARDLLRAAEDRLVHLGAGRFDAMVLAANEDGHRFWGSAGYRPQPSWSRWIKPARLDPL